MQSFPQHLFQHVKRIEFDNHSSPYEMAFALHKQSPILECVDTPLNPGLVVLEALSECTNLKAMRLEVQHWPGQLKVLMDQVFGTERTRC